MGTSLAFLHCLNGLECVDRICPCKKVLAALPNQLTLMPISCICNLYVARGGLFIQSSKQSAPTLYLVREWNLTGQCVRIRIRKEESK